MRVERNCPHCGSHLVIKTNSYGREFLACPRFPYCRYAVSMTDADAVHEIYAPEYCERCGHTGLLPFTKDGKVIPYAFVDCNCKLEMRETVNSALIYPMDFDFSMSDTFRAASFEYCDIKDPARVLELTDVRRHLRAIDTVLASEVPGPSHFQRVMQHLTARINVLQNKVVELLHQKVKVNKAVDRQPAKDSDNVPNNNRTDITDRFLR